MFEASASVAPVGHPSAFRTGPGALDARVRAAGRLLALILALMILVPAGRLLLLPAVADPAAAAHAAVIAQWATLGFSDADADALLHAFGGGPCLNYTRTLLTGEEVPC